MEDLFDAWGFELRRKGRSRTTIEGDERRRQAFAYTFGYIKALIRVVDAEA